VKTTALENLDTLEQIVNYRFRDHSLLAQAMTQRSWAHEQVHRGRRDARNLHNEALEFRRFSALGLIVADYLSRLIHTPGRRVVPHEALLVSAPTLRFWPSCVWVISRFAVEERRPPQECFTR
jgi:hypothetical protein